MKKSTSKSNKNMNAIENVIENGAFVLLHRSKYSIFHNIEKKKKSGASKGIYLE